MKSILRHDIEKSRNCFIVMSIKPGRDVRKKLYRVVLNWSYRKVSKLFRVCIKMIKLCHEITYSKLWHRGIVKVLIMMVILRSLNSDDHIVKFQMLMILSIAGHGPVQPVQPHRAHWVWGITSVLYFTVYKWSLLLCVQQFKYPFNLSKLLLT